MGTAVFLAWGLYAAQLPRYLRDIGTFTYPPTRSAETEHGWPLLFLTRWETTNFRAPGPPDIDSQVTYGKLAVDIALWVALMAATVYLSWRVLSSGWKLSLASLFLITTALAIILAWWRTERAYWYLRDYPELTGLLRAEADTPLLRLLHFSPFVYVPLLVGTICLSMCIVLAALAGARFGARAIKQGSELFTSENSSDRFYPLTPSVLLPGKPPSNPHASKDVPTQSLGTREKPAKAGTPT